jgi:ligand-binding sensor domain-containing protein
MATVGRCAAAASDSNESEREFAVIRYGIENGLPSDDVRAVAQDQQGLLWIGTGSGLTRFDGHQFVLWGAGGEPPLAGSRVSTLLAAKDGSLWVSMGTDGLSRIRNASVSNFGAEVFRGGLISTLFEGWDGTVWAGGRSGLARFHGNRWEYLGAQQGLRDLWILAIQEDHSGALWVASTAGVYRRAPHSDQFRLISKRRLRGLTADASGTVWGTGDLTLARLSEAHGVEDVIAVRGLEGIALMRDSRGRLWLGTRENGLVRVGISARGDAQPKVFQTTLGRKVARSLTEDVDGMIWFATQEGLFRVFDRRISMVPAPTAASLEINSVLAAPDGTIWAGTGHGLARISSTGERSISFAKALLARDVGSIDLGPEGVWLGSRDAVGVLSGERFSALPAPRIGRVVALGTGRPGEVWFCHASDSRLYLWRGGTLSTFEVGASSSRRGRCTAVYTDRKGQVWTGLDDGSLWMRDGVTGGETEVGSTGSYVTAIYQDDAGAIWSGTVAGLGVYKNGKFSVLTERQGLPGNRIAGLVEDRNGDLWLALEPGIVRIAKSEVLRALAEPDYKVRY